MNKRVKRLPGFALFLFLLPAISATAQTPAREASAAIGVMQFDASGTGTTYLAAIRAATPLVQRWMLGELSVSYASLDEQFSNANTRLGVGEGQVQFQLPLARVRPYLGVGGGWLHYFNNSEGRDATTPMVSGSTGIRYVVAPGFLVRGELRLRTWGRGTDFFNSAAEFTAGLGYAF